MQNGDITPRILNLGTGWMWVVSFTPLTLYSRRKIFRYTLGRRLGGPQSQSGHHGEKSKPSSSAVQSVGSCCTDWAIPALLIVVVYRHVRRARTVLWGRFPSLSQAVDSLGVTLVDSNFVIRLSWRFRIRTPLHQPRNETFSLVRVHDEVVPFPKHRAVKWYTRR
jgi:hypothetical protein